MKSEPVIWDIPTRIIHWVIVSAVVMNLLVLEGGDPPHVRVGVIAVIAVAIRVVYGFMTTGPSRWSNTPLRPRLVFDFIRQLKNPSSSQFSGHNPLAAWTYVLIWSCIAALALTGWLLGWDRFFGDEDLETIHFMLGHTLKVLIALHLVGMLRDAYLYKRKTWMGMLTGKRRLR